MQELLALFAFGPTGWGDNLFFGLVTTIQLAVLAFLGGMALGFVGAGMKLSGSRPMVATANAYTTVIRGVPEILILFLLFFGGGYAINQIAQALGHTQYVDFRPFTAGVIGFSLIYGGYCTEVFRGAIQSIPKGQVEAARAMGMGPALRFRRIILPQLWRFALPGLGNLWLIMLKDTALISVIGVQDVVRQAQLGAGSERMPFTFYFALALIYLVLTAISMVVLHFIEKRTRRGVRTAEFG